MTANLRIVPLNHWDFATLSTSAAPATGFPITNTQNSTRSLVCRTASNAAQTWSATWGASPVRTATFFGIFLHNLGGPGSTGTVRAQFYSDAAWSSQIYDTTALVANNITPTDVYDFGVSSNDPFAGSWPYWLWFTETAAFRSVKISFANIPGTYLQASRIFVGKHLEVLRDPAFGATLGWTDLTDRNRSRGGSLRSNVGPSWRVMQMDLNYVRESERAAWLDVVRYCGTGRDFVWSVFPLDGTRLERDHIVNAKFSSLDAIGRQAKYLTKRLQVEEV
jgi:hypothetical protein